MLSDLLGDPLAQPRVHLRIKRTPPEVLGNFPLIVAFGIPPYLARERHQWRQVKLSTEVPQNGRRDVCIGGEKLPMLAHHTELHGQAAQVLRPPMVGQDKLNIALGEGPIEGEFLIGGMGRHQDRRA